MKPRNTFALLNRTVLLLGLVSFLTDVSSEMLYPVTPVFLTTVLGASMVSVGFLEGLAEAIASLLKTFSGSWSDRIQARKPFMYFGYFLTAVAKPLTGFASRWTDVLFARCLDRTGKGLRTSPRDALLADAVLPEQRGAAFGWHRGMDTMGAAIGPLLAVAYLAWHPADYRALYFWAFIPGLLSVLCVFFLRESPTRGAPRAKKPLSLAWRLTPDFRRFLVAWGFFSVTNSSDIFLILKAKSSGLSLTQTILMYCAYNLSYAGLSPVLGHLSDARGRRTVLIGGLLVFAAVYTGFAVAHLQWEFWLLFIVYGFYNAATDGVSKAYAIDLMPDHLKGTTIGILGTVTGLATLVSSTTAGLIWEHVSSSAALIYGAAGALICVGFLLLWRPSGTIESTP